MSTKSVCAPHYTPRLFGLAYGGELAGAQRVRSPSPSNHQIGTSCEALSEVLRLPLVVDLGGCDVPVAEKILHLPDVHAV